MKRIILSFLLFVLSFSVYAQSDAEPFIKEIYFTTLDGERIEGTVSVDEKEVYLVIVSTNAIGEDMLITMDEDEEYFYEKKFLSGGSSIKIPITADIEKVLLEIYNPRIKKHAKKRRKAEGYKKAKDAKESKKKKKK